MKDWIPQGYEPQEIPPDYDGPLFLESQMRYAYRMGQKDMRERAANLLDCTDLRALKDCPEQLAYVSSIATGYAKVIRALPIEGDD